MIGQPWDTLLLIAIAVFIIIWSKRYGWEDITEPWKDR